MTVQTCEIPSASVLDHGMVAAAYFHDAYRAPLRNAQASVVDIFFAVFGHHPLWIKAVLISRNAIASACGLETPTVSDIMNTGRKNRYEVGDKIGPWPIFSLSDNELVAGRDNTHLDFRLSVLRELGGDAASIVISTVCTTHNTFGKFYLMCIVPFHKWGVQQLLKRSIAAGRL